MKLPCSALYEIESVIQNNIPGFRRMQEKHISYILESDVEIILIICIEVDENGRKSITCYKK